MKTDMAQDAQQQELDDAVEDILRRILLGHTTTPLGVCRRLTQVAEEHQRTFEQVRAMLQVRAQDGIERGTLTAEQLERLTLGVRPFVGA